MMEELFTLILWQFPCRIMELVNMQNSEKVWFQTNEPHFIHTIMK